MKRKVLLEYAVIFGLDITPRYSRFLDLRENISSVVVVCEQTFAKIEKESKNIKKGEIITSSKTSRKTWKIGNKIKLKTCIVHYSPIPYLSTNCNEIIQEHAD